MCISANEARFSDTYLYAGEAMRDEQLVHVMAYQNRAESIGPNAMLLPVPTNTAMGPENIIDTRGFKNFMVEMSEATQIRSRGMLKGGAVANAVQVFESGSFTIVLANSAAAIKKALEQVPENKRPELKTRLLMSLSGLYTEHKFVLCCWDGEIKAEPIMLWYVPSNKDELFAPALDAHDGEPPQLDKNVLVDHHISFSTLSMNGHKVHYSNSESKPHSLLPKCVYGTQVRRELLNGDFYASVEVLNKNRRKMYRKAPTTASPEENLPLNGWS